MPDPLDLIDSTTCTNMLAAGNLTLATAQTAVLPTLITAASREIQKEINRIIPATNYDDVVNLTMGRPDRGEPATASLRQYPVNGSPLVWGNRTNALTIQNTDTVGNQVAHVAFTTVGDPEIQLTYTGLTLTRIASGVVTTNTITWATNPPYGTVQQVSDAVNAVGGGWSCTPALGTPSPGLYPSALLLGIREPKNAFSPGASLSIFSAPLTASSIDRETGILSVTAGMNWYPGGFAFALSSGWPDSDDPDYPNQGSQVRVQWNAGYATIPAAFQVFVTETIRYLFMRLRYDGLFKSETILDYSYEIRQAMHALPDAVWAAIMKYKNWKL